MPKRRKTLDDDAIFARESTELSEVLCVEENRLTLCKTQTLIQSNKGHFKHVLVCIFPYISNSSQ